MHTHLQAYCPQLLLPSTIQAAFPAVDGTSHWQLPPNSKAEIVTAVLCKERNNCLKEKETLLPRAAPSTAWLMGASAVLGTHHEPAVQEGQRDTLYSKYSALNYVPSSTSARAIIRTQLHPQLLARSWFASSLLWEIACSDPAAGGDVSSREADCFLLSIMSRELNSPVQIVG